MAAFYPYNDTSLDQGERDYLKKLADFAEDQNLDDDLRGYVRGITIAFTAFAAFIVGLRFLARHLQAARYLIDDYLMLLALVLLIGNMAMNLLRKSEIRNLKINDRPLTQRLLQLLIVELDCIPAGLHYRRFNFSIAYVLPNPTKPSTGLTWCSDNDRR